ncbi:MAG: glycosyltransferase family 4 protein [Candidatus Omnitrophica bacterium]|nr:glycosyltransferase family 4 protein [Candidatus Omnitrophota bacterium]
MFSKVLISHPGKQHVHQVVYSLQQAGVLAKFITSLWYQPKKMPYNIVNFLPPRARSIVEREFKKRYFEKLDEKYIEQFPVLELIRKGLAWALTENKKQVAIYLVHQIHDWHVSKSIARINPDVIIGYETSSLKTFKEARQRKIKTILDFSQVHYKFINVLIQRYAEFGSLFRDKRLLSKINLIKEKELEYADHIIALSDFAKKTLVTYGIKEERIHIANLGVDLDTFKQKTSYRKNGMFKVLYVGPITKRKGISILLEAYKQLNLKNAQLTLIGGMADAKGVLKNYEGIYKHIPYLLHKQLASYYQDADIFVLPSYLDSWGMVVMEAMASGTPVIISDNTGTKEAVRDNVDGFIIPSGDVEMLKDKIEFFYRNREKCGELGSNARKQAEKYKWESYHDRMIHILREVYNRQ